MLESMKRGQVSRQDAYHMFKVDPIKTDRVYELLVAMGWIQGDAPTLVQGFYSQGCMVRIFSVKNLDLQDSRDHGQDMQGMFGSCLGHSMVAVATMQCTARTIKHQKEIEQK